MPRHDFSTNGLPDGFSWLNAPEAVAFDGALVVTSKASTDFWQRTHYGFRRDDGHFLFTGWRGDFTLETRAESFPQTRYDQCGLMVRIDGENWIKASVEYEDARSSRLGSVVTNLGYSDWATQDIESSGATTRSYRIHRRGADFMVESSPDGNGWHQLRIAHLHVLDGQGPHAEVQIGLYACSPLGTDFRCRFELLDIDAGRWGVDG